MENAYNEDHAKELIMHYPDIAEQLILRTYTARLMGADPDLILHGGGGSSVKLRQTNVLGEDQEILFVTAGSADLANIEPQDFIALDLVGLQKFRRLEQLDPVEMDRQLQIRKLRPCFLNPPDESFLHAFLPHRHIDHAHADSILILTNQPEAPKMVRDVLGAKIAVLPYTMSGLLLAKAAAAQYDEQPDLEAIVIINHGIFTFGEDAQASYSRMIDYVNRAETFITSRIKDKLRVPAQSDITPSAADKSSAAAFAQLVRGACTHEGPEARLDRFRVEFRNAPDLLKASLAADAQTLCDSGVLTPEQVTLTKNRYIYIGSLPDQFEDTRALLKGKIDKFAQEYHRCWQAQSKIEAADRYVPDPYPRVFLVRGLGLFTLGFSHREAEAAADIAEHTIRAKLRAAAVGAYVPIAAPHIFEMACRRRHPENGSQDRPALLRGQVALITGAGGAIGCGIADRLLRADAAVVLSDIDESRLQKAFTVLRDRYPAGEMECIPFDVTNFQSVATAYAEISRRLGGLDIVVPNAGIAHVAAIEDLDPRKLDQVIAVNLKGTFNTIKAAIPVFKRQDTGGNVVVISSKNVFDPGAAFGAYSAAKAGAHQIARIAALELAPLGVRVNMINPDAVFGDEKVSSNLWDLVGPDRMKSRGLDFEGLQEYYRNRNLLKAKVLAEHVGNAVVFFASNQTPTTGASLPVDGGIPAAFPR